MKEILLTQFSDNNLWFGFVIGAILIVFQLLHIIKKYQEFHNSVFFRRKLNNLIELDKHCDEDSKCKPVIKSEIESELFYKTYGFKCVEEKQDFIHKLYGTRYLSAKQLKNARHYFRLENGEYIIKIDKVDIVIAKIGLFLAIVLQLLLILYLIIAMMSKLSLILLIFVLLVLAITSFFAMEISSEWFIQRNIRKLHNELSKKGIQLKIEELKKIKLLR